MIGLEPFENGEIYWNNIAYKSMNIKQRKKFKSEMSIIFQNALGAVNPKFKVSDVLLEPLKINYCSYSKEEQIQECNRILEMVGLEKVELNRMATSLSGGQLQRLCIGRALINNPKIIIFDESLSGLDYIVQKQILELLGNLKEKLGLTYIFISHDFDLCYYICDEVFVMDKGEIIEKIKINSCEIEIKSEIVKKIIGIF